MKFKYLLLLALTSSMFASESTTDTRVISETKNTNLVTILRKHEQVLLKLIDDIDFLKENAILRNKEIKKLEGTINKYKEKDAANKKINKTSIEMKFDKEFQKYLNSKKG
ncbi:hypothetical protein [Sulfurimonas sp.]|uniref:hypothetical protein n=1 Tax=Sulfurimonas sp. TaxID=2022749 RepID=UPI0025CFF409|nr:hypothetical protein [Sulfurimonas sp.]